MSATLANDRVDARIPEGMRNFLIYLLGVLIVVCALAYGAHMAGVATHWVLIGAAVAFGLGVMAGISKTQKPD
jgi:hypothetical protein